MEPKIRQKIKVEGISCTNCATTIKKAVSKEFNDEVICDVNVPRSEVYVEYDNKKYSQKQIEKTLKNSGYKPVTQQKNSSTQKMKREIILATILTTPLLIGMFAHLSITKQYVPAIFSNHYLQFTLATIVQFYSGRHFYKGAYFGLKQKVFGMDALVVIGSTTAYIYSTIEIVVEMLTGQMAMELYYEVGAVVITVVMIGKYLEHKVKERTTQELEKIVGLSQTTANLKGQGVIDSTHLRVDDIVIVYPNETIPSDGVVIKGNTYIDQSMFTGESVPVHKEVEAKVIGGSINLSEEIEVRITKVGDETVLSKMILMIEKASLTKVKMQRIADKIAQIFVPIVLIIAVFTFIINYSLDVSLLDSFSRMLAVILISCPCALGLATPTAIMVANGVSAKKGILYKGGQFFEVANKINVVCFDKTGTLTNGDFTITNYDLKSEHIPILVAVESKSNHPISKAVTEYFKQEETLPSEEFKILPGKGITAKVNGQQVWIGNKKLMQEANVELGQKVKDYEDYLEQGLTTNLIAIDNQIVGLYGIEDSIKDESKAVVSNLISRGIKVVMITGDNQKVATKIAKSLGITEMHYNVLPEEKAEIVKQYKNQESVVAFVGDGVNDSVALKVADVGISLKQGSDLAIESSDITLMSGSLKEILTGIEISKATNKNILQNFFWAFSYNIVAIPLASLGLLNMVVAAIAMGFSSILVVLNALRLKLKKFD